MLEPRTTPSKVLNCFLRKNISFTETMTLETGTSLDKKKLPKGYLYLCSRMDFESKIP